MLKTACLVLLLVSLPQCSQSSSSGSTDSASNSKNTEDNDTGKDTTSSTEEVKPCNETTQKLPTKLAIAVVIADPYIECARLCADSNQNGLCDQQEPLSSFSKSDGSAGFSESISPGDRLVLKEKGRHNGVPYKLVLSAIVPSPTALTITQNLFVLHLPLETLLATPEQIVDILQRLASQISRSPMSERTRWKMSLVTCTN